MKTSKTLIAFFIVYNIITLVFITNIQRDQSASLGYIFIFPFFWIVGGLTLGILFWVRKIRLKGATNKILLFFSTPLPLLSILMIWANLPSSKLITSSEEYNSNGHRHRTVRYEYEPGKFQRIEYYISKDEVTETNPFPISDIWLKDSTWIYYNKDGTIKKTEIHIGLQ